MNCSSNRGSLASKALPLSRSPLPLKVSDPNSKLSNQYIQNAFHYEFPLEEVPRYHWSDPAAMKLLKEEKPVILVGTNLVQTAVEAWNREYLEKSFGQGPLNILKSKDNIFPHFDIAKARAEEITPTVDVIQKNFHDYAALTAQDPNHKYYLEQILNDTVGPDIVKDFLGFNWKWLSMLQHKFGWGQLTSNTLFVSSKDSLIPCHYDEHHNLFSHISGHKRFVLFSPQHFKSLYPYPVHHPLDRQSRVNLRTPDYQDFPQLRHLTGQMAHLGPGDVLYIPIYWFHEVESLTDCISVNFLCKQNQGPGRIAYPLTHSQKLAVRRNIEKMLAQALGGTSEVGEFLNELVAGRF